MEHSNLGLRRDGASINEGKDPERVGHLEQSADQGLGRLGSHAEPGLHGRSAGTREAGTLHWQFAVQWQNPRSFAAIKKDLPLAHFEEVRSWAAAVTYCQKADTRDSGPWEFGTRPTGGSGKAQAEDWETWYQLAAEGKFKEIPPNSNQAPGQFGAHSPPESQIHRPNRCARSLDLGRSGVGKSHFARQVLGAEGYYLSSTISGGTAIRARRSSSWRTLTRKRSSSFTTTSRFGRTAGVHWRDQGGAVAPFTDGW